MSNKNIAVQKTVENKKEIGYSKGEARVNFTMNIDKKQEMKDLVECLQASISDIEGFIKDLDDKRKK